jgi:hypothetical protein
MYSNQFQKYDPQPFVEAEITPIVVSDDGPFMAPHVCRAALQRAVGKIFYHAGYEEFQPSALDAATDAAAAFFGNLVQSYNLYTEACKAKIPQAGSVNNGPAYEPRFTFEEKVLHTLDENGVDLDQLDGYVKDDVDRLGSKLGVMHERMKSHLAELLVLLILPIFRYILLIYMNSGPHSIQTQLVQMALVHSTTKANSLWAEILLKTLVKISSVSRSWAWTRSLAYPRLVCHCIFCRIACIKPTSHRTPSMYF